MSVPVIAFSTGLFLIIVAVLGGGVQVREIWQIAQFRVCAEDIDVRIGCCVSWYLLFKP